MTAVLTGKIRILPASYICLYAIITMTPVSTLHCGLGLLFLACVAGGNRLIS